MALCVGPVLSTARFSFGTLTFKLRSKFTIQYGYIVYQDLSHLDGDRPYTRTCFRGEQCQWLIPI